MRLEYRTHLLRQVIVTQHIGHLRRHPTVIAAVNLPEMLMAVDSHGIRFPFLRICDAASCRHKPATNSWSIESNCFHRFIDWSYRTIARSSPCDRHLGA